MLEFEMLCNEVDRLNQIIYTGHDFSNAESKRPFEACTDGNRLLVRYRGIKVFCAFAEDIKNMSVDVVHKTIQDAMLFIHQDCTLLSQAGD